MFLVSCLCFAYDFPPFCSLRSSLFHFLLAGQSKSQGEVRRTHRCESKKRNGRGGGEERKSLLLSPNILPNAVCERQLGITIGQSCINQCQQLVNRFNAMITTIPLLRSDQLWPYPKIILLNLLCRKLLKVSHRVEN